VLEAIWIYLLLAFVVIVPIVYSLFFKKKLQAKAAEIGTAKGLNLEEKVKASNEKTLDKIAAELGQRITFADAVAGRGVVDAVLGAAKSVTPAGPDNWHLKFAAADDVSLAWTTDAAGGVLAVTRSRHMVNGPVGERAWRKVVAALTAAAAERGVALEVVTVPLVPMNPQDEKEPLWVAG